MSGETELRDSCECVEEAGFHGESMRAVRRWGITEPVVVETQRLIARGGIDGIRIVKSNRQDAK